MRKNIFKTTVITMAVLTAAFGMTACGKKKTEEPKKVEKTEEKKSL